MRRMALAAVAFVSLAAPMAAEEASSCVLCHGDEDFFGEEGAALIASFANDVHASVGLSCEDCHGGNPDPALWEDLDLAMDPTWEPAPYLGAPEPSETPAFCGSCHSDPVVMHRYRPDARVDQEREYWTSRHGARLAEGDDGVATCTSCHGVHGIRRAEDPEATVYPTRVADTCFGCHGDAELMAGRTLPDGRPLPIDQYGRWRRSVHASALLERSDLSAPTCNDCHGNHGAAPPGLDSIAFVCGQCHGREAELFRASGKLEGFEDHAFLLEDAGPDGCGGCHEPPEPQASFDGTHAFTECSSCHRNHAVVRPTVAMLEPLPAEPCSFCHSAPGQPSLAEPATVTQRFSETLAALLTELEPEGLSAEDRFNRLVDRLLTLPAHRQGGEGAEGGLKREVELLFDKFRIGKTRFTYVGPAGEPVEGRVVRCGDCHAAEPLMADSPVGLDAAAAFAERSRELALTTATAQRKLLAARRGGVETREVLQELEGAIDSQIGLEVLIHTFSTDEEGEFMKRHAEGMAHGEAALRLSEEALAELVFRRRGLAVALVFVVLLLIALTLKIRQLGAP